MKHDPITAVTNDVDTAHEFISAQTPIMRGEGQVGFCQYIRGKLVAAVLFEQWNGSNIFVHLAGTPGTNWITRQLIFNSFDYVFNQLGCRRLTAWVEATNLQSRRFCERMGYTREAILREAGSNGVDVHVYVMFREDCRYA